MRYNFTSTVALLFFCVGSCQNFSVAGQQETTDKNTKPPAVERDAKDDRQRPILHFDLLGKGDQVRPGTIARNLDGSIAKKMHDVPGAVWSPRGLSFAYFSNPQPEQPQALIVKSLAGEPRTLMTVPEQQVPIWYPAWSPDGQRIAVIVAREAKENISFKHQADFSIKIIDAKSGNVERSIEVPVGVLEWPSPTTPSNTFGWSPDGKKILVSWASSIVFTIDSGQALPITKGYSVAEWAPDSQSVYFFDFKPEYEDAPEGILAVKGLYQRELAQDSAKLLADDAKLAEWNIFDHPGVYFMRLTLSPLGNKMAMLVGAEEDPDKRSSCLLVYDITGEGITNLDKPTRRVQFERERVFVHVNFSPDEQNIACLVMTEWDRFSIETMNLESGKWKKLADLSFRVGKYGVAAIDFIGWHKAVSWAN